MLLRFLYDKSSMEYLYYKRKVAELRKNLLRPENTPDNGKFTFSHMLSFVSVFFVIYSNAKVNLKRMGSIQYSIIVLSYHYGSSESFGVCLHTWSQNDVQIRIQML